MRTEALTLELLEKSQSILQTIEVLKDIEPGLLNWKPDAKSWCALECVEHLNRYADYYNPAINKAIRNQSSPPETFFKPGVMGSYFCQSMLPKEKLNKMKTFKEMNPINAQLDKNVIDKFVERQIQFMELIKASQSISLMKTHVPASISKLIRMRLGDTFQFLVNHNLRHIEQIQNVLQKAKEVIV